MEKTYKELESELEAIKLGIDVEYDNRGANALALRMIELIDNPEIRTGTFGGKDIEKLAKKIEKLKNNAPIA